VPIDLFSKLEKQVLFWIANYTQNGKMRFVPKTRQRLQFRIC